MPTEPSGAEGRGLSGEETLAIEHKHQRSTFTRLTTGTTQDWCWRCDQAWPCDTIRLLTELERGAAREAALRKALRHATTVLENVTELFHPNYLLQTAALLKECKDALALTEEPAP